MTSREKGIGCNAKKRLHPISPPDSFLSLGKLRGRARYLSLSAYACSGSTNCYILTASIDVGSLQHSLGGLNQARIGYVPYSFNVRSIDK